MPLLVSSTPAGHVPWSNVEVNMEAKGSIRGREHIR